MFDLIIRHGKIVDGNRDSIPFVADIGIEKDEITQIGNLENEVAKREINARGKIVSPGFIDIDNHSDVHWTLFRNPDQNSLIRQGVTTILGGNCGSSLAPILGEGSINSLRKWISLRDVQIDWERMGGFLDFLEDNRPLKVNFGTLVGYATLRRGLLGEDIRLLINKELGILEREIQRSLEEGAWGLSIGLSYTHLQIVSPQEILSLAETVKQREGLFSVHLRDEKEGLLSALKEVLEVAEKTGVNLEISHLKAIGQKAWPLFRRALELVEEARQKGLKINFDVYPYAFSNPVIYTLLPPRLQTLNREAIIEKLKNPQERQKVIAEMKENSTNYSRVLIASSPLSKLLAKKSLAEIAFSRETSPEETLIDLILASENQGSVILKLLSEKNVSKAIQSQSSFISSNGAGYRPEEEVEGSLIHPRSFGTFPRFLAFYVKKEKLLSLSEAIYKITSGPAEKIGLLDRGQIKEGYKADITVLDWDNLADHSTIEKPFAYPGGIEYVVVNGKITVEQEILVEGVRSGQILRKK